MASATPSGRGHRPPESIFSVFPYRLGFDVEQSLKVRVGIRRRYLQRMTEVRVKWRDAEWTYEVEDGLVAASGMEPEWMAAVLDVVNVELAEVEQ